MTRPVPAPKTPRPIRDTPHQGHYAVVVSFRTLPHAGWDLDGFERAFRRSIGDFLRLHTRRTTDLDVAVRVIGAGGEASEDEGLWPPGSLS